MTPEQKRLALALVAVIGIGAAAFSAYRSFSGPKEEIVGTIDFGPGGGKASEQGKSSNPQGDPSGMPPGMAEGK